MRISVSIQLLSTDRDANACVLVTMGSILLRQQNTLLSVEGTNVWSGQQVQEYNSQAIAWGGFSHDLFGLGKRYQLVPLGYVIGLFVPIPFWIVHRYYPKLRADYLYKIG